MEFSITLKLDDVNLVLSMLAKHPAVELITSIRDQAEKQLQASNPVPSPVFEPVAEGED